MLITIYNNNGSDRFETDFKSNLILPKNCELKLTNAYIALSHEISIAETTIKITANDATSTASDVVLSAGTYTLQALAQQINTKAQAKSDADGLDLKINMEYDNNKGYAPDCFTLNVDCESLLANIFQNLVFATADYGNFVVVVDDDRVSTATIRKHTSNGINYIGCTDILDKAATPVAVASWGYFIENKDIPLQYWLREGTGGGTSTQPPVTIDGAGAYTFQDNGNAENYYVGLSNGSTDLSGITDDTFDLISAIDNAPVYALVVKTTNGSYGAGEVYFYENNGTTINIVSRITATQHPHLFPLTDDDTIGVVCNENSVANYYIKKDGTTTWSSVGVSHTAQRHTFDATDLYPILSIYSTNSGTAFGDASIKNINGSFKGSDLKVDNYGKYVQWDWNGFEDEMGYKNTKYTDDNSTGGGLASLKQNNEDDVEVNGTGTESSWKTAPYINLICESLPVNSYTDTDTDTDNNGLDNSKCIASIPRYDNNGNFNIGYNLTYNPVEANVIKLNNAEEINVSQLRFRLQQSDGQIPQDLSTPMGFVLDFNGNF